MTEVNGNLFCLISVPERAVHYACDPGIVLPEGDTMSNSTDTRYRTLVNLPRTFAAHAETL